MRMTTIKLDERTILNRLREYYSLYRSSEDLATTSEEREAVPYHLGAYNAYIDLLRELKGWGTSKEWSNYLKEVVIPFIDAKEKQRGNIETLLYSPNETEHYFKEPIPIRKISGNMKTWENISSAELFYWRRNDDGIIEAVGRATIRDTKKEEYVTFESGEKEIYEVEV